MASLPGETSLQSPISESVNAPELPPRTVQFIDHWLFVIMAAFFFISILVGFIPSSLAKLAQIEAGARPPFPPILHVHAVLMGSWMCLLLAQTVLVATGRQAFHRTLGLASLVLVPAIVITAIILLPTIFGMAWGMYQSAPAGPEKDGLAGLIHFLSNLSLLQGRIVFVFPILVGLALSFRNSDPSTHKRLMVLATVVPMGAGLDRMSLPGAIEGDRIMLDLYMLLWIAPMFFWDLYRQKRVHRAYWIWLLVLAPFTIAIHVLHDNPMWLEFVPKLMGVQA